MKCLCQRPSGCRSSEALIPRHPKASEGRRHPMSPSLDLPRSEAGVGCLVIFGNLRAVKTLEI